MKTSTLPIAAGWLAAIVTMGSAAAAPGTAPSSDAGAATAAASTKDSRALFNQRMRKCKEMTGDEKAACTKDAHSAAAAKARKEIRASGK